MYMLKAGWEGHLTANDFGAIRKMRPATVAQWLELHAPFMPQENKDDVVAWAASWEPSVVSTADVKKVQSYFIAAAWLAGASWGQLSKMFGVTRSTLIRSAEPRFGFGEDRQAIRIENNISFTRVSALRESFTDIVTEGKDVRSFTPITLAQALIRRADAKGTESSGDEYDELDAPDRRIASTDSD